MKSARRKRLDTQSIEMGLPVEAAFDQALAQRVVELRQDRDGVARLSGETFRALHAFVRAGYDAATATDPIVRKVRAREALEALHQATEPESK